MRGALSGLLLAVTLGAGACSLLDPEKADPNRPNGADSAEQAAAMYLHAVAGGDLDGLRHIMPDAAACKVLDELPDCFEIQPRLESRVLWMQVATGPYANSTIKPSSTPSPIPGSEMWLAYSPGHPQLVIITLNANGKYYAFARAGL
nr:hypothetical protein [Kofleriaceae bacterium]